MGRVGLVAAVLVVGGAMLNAPGLIVAGALLGFLRVARAVTGPRMLRDVEYRRELGSHLAGWGDEVDLRITVTNRKLLPVMWLTADDHLSEDAVIRDRPIEATDEVGRGILRNSWSLGPFEEVTRPLRIVAARRGRFDFSTVWLSAPDLFGGGSTMIELDRPDGYRVAPRYVPVRTGVPRESDEHGRLAPRGPEDPTLFAGVRPYVPGDPVRRIHWRSTARTGSPVTKVFDRSAERELVVALDIQTVEGPSWMKLFDEELAEALIVVAASVARSAIVDGSACGLAVAAYSGRPAAAIRVAPRAGTAQFAVIGDALARLSLYASQPFEYLLAGLVRWLPRPARIVTISSRDPLSYVAVQRRLIRSGYPVDHVAVGPDAPAAVARLRRLSIPVRMGRLDPDWETARVLDLAS